MTPIKATVFILGSSHFARELLCYIKEPFKASNVSRFGLRSDSEFYFVDNNNLDALSIKDYLNKISSTPNEYYSIMGTGNCKIKKRMSEQIVKPILSFIHPKATNLGKTERGSVLAPGAVVAPGAIVGAHVLCNYNCTIGHGTQIGDYSTIGPCAAIGGNCTIGNSVYVGSGSCIRENISIGDNCLVAMGAVVVENMPSEHIAIGVPAKILPIHEWEKTQLDKEHCPNLHGVEQN